MRFSINCSTVICSPTVIVMLSWEKLLVKPMAPGSISYHICFQFTFICIFYFLHLYYKIPKIYLPYHTISIRSHFRKWSWRDWQPLCRVGCEFFVCLCRFVGLVEKPPTGLIPWFSKTEGNSYLLCCITLSSSRKTNASSRCSKNDFWHRCRGGLRSSQDIPSTHHKLISLAFTLFAIRLSFSSPPLLKRFSKTFAFSLPSFRLIFCYHVPSFCLHLRLLKVYGSSSTC